MGRSGDCRFGIWQDLPCVAVSRCLAKSGWNFIVLDMQHGPMSFETAYECVHAAHREGAECWMRVSVDAPSEVQRALDLGADAVVVPMVNSLAMARSMANAAKYPPTGHRSLGGDCSLYRGGDYFERANDETKLIVQVEHIDSVSVVEEMMALEGVDGCFIGPTDLAISMNLSRHDYEQHPLHASVVERVLLACHQYGKLACCNTYSAADFESKLGMGFDCLTQQSEVSLLMEASRARTGAYRSAVRRENHVRDLPGPKYMERIQSPEKRIS
ncbi:MAG TPA: aldolase/citrate lyase family protein [Lacipirellulaceae bacterium]|nr:aldolase/citrate lyase family protein [Lacipirellulaceae bacterium]HMP05192.1 aldolase/citrate lyase family protein [Lacipirellulaceae bacterium]